MTICRVQLVYKKLAATRLIRKRKRGHKYISGASAFEICVLEGVIMHDYSHDIHMWIAAIESGYLKEPSWVTWAEKHVVSAEPTQFWLVDLYQTINVQEALGILRSAYPHPSDVDYVAALLGFLYLRYEQEELSLNDFLKVAGNESDCHNYDHPSCESIYALLTRHEQAEARREASAACEIEAAFMFANLSRHVKRWIATTGIL